MTPKFHKPGFRFSWSDAVVIIAGLLSTWLGWKFIGPFAMIFLIVLFHFFLFCNVFRIRRRYELIWAATFVVNVLLWSTFGNIDWWRILAVQMPITVAAIVLELRSDRYHGVGSGTLVSRRAMAKK